MMKCIVLLLAFVCWCSAEEVSDDTVSLHYKCVLRHFDGETDLPPILLLHGLSERTSIWNGIYEVLAMQTKREVCMADARNHGLSPKAEEFSFDLMAADTVRLMDKLKFKRALVVGQSMGGKTAAVIALKYPDRVEKVVLEDMRPNSITPEAFFMFKTKYEMIVKSLDAVPEGATNQEAQEAILNFLRKSLGKVLDKRMEESIMTNLMICENGKCRFRMDIGFIKKLLKDPEAFNKVYDGKFDGDSLFIYGTLSPFKVNEAEDEIRRQFPKAQLVPIEGAGHGVHQGKPREYLSALIKFINANDTDSGLQ